MLLAVLHSQPISPSPCLPASGRISDGHTVDLNPALTDSTTGLASALASGSKASGKYCFVPPPWTTTLSILKRFGLESKNLEKSNMP